MTPVLLVPLPEESVHVQPVGEHFEPPVSGMIGVAHAEAVATVLIKVKLNGPARIVPRLDQTEVAAKEEVIGGNRYEHRRSVLWYVDRIHAAVDWSDERQLHRLRLQRGMHRESGAGG